MKTKPHNKRVKKIKLTQWKYDKRNKDNFM